MMSDKESQVDEVEALQSIFSEEEFSSTNENGVFCIQFYAFVTLPEDFKIVFRNLSEPENGASEEQTIKVHYLPPIEMHLKLPHNYPSVSPPYFQLCCSWLSYDMLAKVCKELDRLWAENKGSEILFIWTQFLKEECLNFLKITDKLDLSVKYTRELVHVKNSKFTQKSSSDAILSEQSKDIDCLNNNNNYNSSNNNKVTNNCDIQKRLLLDGVTAADNSVVDKSDTDSVCSSEKSVHETTRGGVNNNVKNFKSHVTSKREHGNFDKNRNSNYRNNESEHRYHVNGGSRNRKRNDKRRPYYDTKKGNESEDRIVVNNESSCDRRKVPFDRKRSNVIAKSFNADTNKWETVTTDSSVAVVNQIQNFRDTRKTYDKNRKFRNDSFVSESSNGHSSSSSGGVGSNNDVSSNSKTYNTYEFFNSKYRRYPQRRHVTMYASRHENKTVTKECKQTKTVSEKESIENENTSLDIVKCRRSDFDGASQTDVSLSSSLLAVNSVDSSSCTVEVPSNSSQRSSDNKLSSSLLQLSVNNDVRESTESAHSSSDVGSKTSQRIGQKRVYDKRIRKPKQHKKHLHEVIEDYDRERSKTEFGRNVFMCNICLVNKLGITCMQFKPCEHVFCRECISGYIEVRIKEGTVHAINCPEPKCGTEVSPPQIRELVSPELFARYDHILLASILDTMGDIIYCPRSSCQYPVSKEENEKMAICPECKYVFCIYCKMVYHGVEPCRLKNEEKLTLIKEYQNADKETKLKLEQRYGKSLLTSLVENHMSETWIYNNSKPCPNCNTAIEKSDGCNKMACWKCNTFFCWLCGARLDPSVPYKHYYDTQSRCNNRLFEGIITEGNDSDNEENVQFENEEPDMPFEMGYNMFVINLNLDPELENHLLVRIDNVD